jgi:hypothetical protein
MCNETEASNQKREKRLNRDMSIKGEVRKGLLTSMNQLSRKVHSFYVPIFLFIQQLHDAPVATPIVKNAALRVQQAIEPGKVDGMSKDFGGGCSIPILNLIMKM